MRSLLVVVRVSDVIGQGKRIKLRRISIGAAGHARHAEYMAAFNREAVKNLLPSGRSPYMAKVELEFLLNAMAFNLKKAILKVG